MTDTTFRDAHQSLMATRVRSIDMLATAHAVAQRLPNLFSLEMWGGATFDTSLRFLHEDPWQRLRELLREHSQHLFSNAVAWRQRRRLYVVSRQRHHGVRARSRIAQGIDIFRIFDSLNSIATCASPLTPCWKPAPFAKPAICYTGDILDRRRAKYSLKYYVTMAKQLEKLGAHFLAIKDMAGLCKPYAAFALVKALREEIGIPVHFHTHDTSGINAASLLKAAEAGVDVADGAIAAMSGGTSQPNLNSRRRSAAPNSARHATRYRGSQRVLRLLGNRSQLLSAVRFRTQGGFRAAL